MQGGNYENTYLIESCSFCAMYLEESYKISLCILRRSEDHWGKSVSLFLVRLEKLQGIASVYWGTSPKSCGRSNFFKVRIPYKYYEIHVFTLEYLSLSPNQKQLNSKLKTVNNTELSRSATINLYHCFCRGAYYHLVSGFNIFGLRTAYIQIQLNLNNTPNTKKKKEDNAK